MMILFSELYKQNILEIEMILLLWNVMVKLSDQTGSTFVLNEK